MAITKPQVLDALRKVIDPYAGIDIVTQNLVDDLVIQDKFISFTVNIPISDKEYTDALKKRCEQVVQDTLSGDVVLDIHLQLKDKNAPEPTPQPKAEPEDLLAGVKNIIAVASGKGGVGKSTIAANLAVSLANAGYQVGLVDTDIYGPSIPTMFQLRGERPNINTKRKLVPLEKYGVKLLSMGFLVDQDDAVVWRGPMVSSAVKQFLTEVVWGDLDYLIMDLPPGTGDIQLTIVQTVPLTGAVIVSTPQDVALDDARKGVTMFRKVNVPVLGIVENMAYFTPPELPEKKYHIFGKDGARNLAAKLEVPFLGEVPIEQVVREGGDSGVPVATLDPASTPSALVFQHIAARVAAETDNRNESKKATEPIKIKIR
ncbi:MAG: Mrp/NBP35 family ATP-binding protein [Balneolales bacterium]|nr:Mrp/NBP35 family ATP-binding protein [Balneolales bacterium]